MKGVHASLQGCSIKAFTLAATALTAAQWSARMCEAPRVRTVTRGGAQKIGTIPSVGLGKGWGRWYGRQSQQHGRAPNLRPNPQSHILQGTVAGKNPG